MRMTNVELAHWLGGVPLSYVTKLPRAKRKLFNRMRAFELWAAGFGPRPPGVIVCYPSGRRVLFPGAKLGRKNGAKR